MTFLGIFCIVTGFILTFVKNWAWAWTEFSNSMAGRVSQRTSAWEVYMTVTGVISLALGLFMVFTPLKARKETAKPRGVVGVMRSGNHTTYLKSNGIYQQRIVDKNGKVWNHTGKWEPFVDGRLDGSKIVLNNYLVVHGAVGKTKPISSADRDNIIMPINNFQ